MNSLKLTKTIGITIKNVAENYLASDDFINKFTNSFDSRLKSIESNLIDIQKSILNYYEKMQKEKEENLKSINSKVTEQVRAQLTIWALRGVIAFVLICIPAGWALFQFISKSNLKI